MLRIAVATDHAGFPYKEPIVRALEQDGFRVEDLGTDSTAPADYPDQARAVGRALVEHRADLGVLVCGSGAGVCIAANKIRGIRAALCHDLYTARQAREDDNANVLCLGARVIGPDLAVALARAFVNARFSGAERHVRRLAKVLALEEAELPPLRPPRRAREPAGLLELPPVAAALAELEHRQAGPRLWAKDASLWSEDEAVQAAIRRRLGWLTAPLDMRARADELVAFAGAVRRDGVTDVVLLGMGGSSLAPEVLARAFGAAPGAPALSVLDTTDPGTIRAVRGRLKLPHTLFLVASKSGTTVEVQALYAYFRSEVAREAVQPGAHFVAITDAATPLDRLARQDGFRHVFLNDPDIGGRFSALSLFGLVPGALIGADLRTLLDDAASMVARCRDFAPLADNPGIRLGAVLGGLARAGRDKVTLLVSEPLRSFGAWLEQLLTESTGKQGRGLIVVDDEPPAPPAAYGDDRVFVAIALGDDQALAARAAEVEGAGHSVITLTLGSPADLGGEFFRWEMATAVIGALLGLNPFDEPDVARAKAATAAALGAFAERGRLPDWPAGSVDEVVRLLRAAQPGDYLALLAYLTPTPATTGALQALRRLVRDRTRLATTLGWGPRYLHSTGQLHKGGPPTAILLVFTAVDPQDVPVPGRDHGFATLQRAQALGDVRTLAEAGRRVVWLPLAGDAAAALGLFTEALATRLG